MSVSNPSSLDAQAMDLDNDGNLVVAGSFKGLVDFDHGPGVTISALGILSTPTFML